MIESFRVVILQVYSVFISTLSNSIIIDLLHIPSSAFSPLYPLLCPATYLMCTFYMVSLFTIHSFSCPIVLILIRYLSFTLFDYFSFYSTLCLLSCGQSNSFALLHDLLVIISVLFYSIPSFTIPFISIFSILSEMNYYPPELTDWWMDDWISLVYGMRRTFKAKKVSVIHHTGE